MRTRPKALTTTWGLRIDDYGSYVRAIGDSIEVIHKGTVRMSLRRADARLFAKRINQCLDETRKR